MDDLILVAAIIFPFVVLIICGIQATPMYKKWKQEKEKQQEIERQKQLKQSEKCKAEYMQIAKSVDEITQGIKIDNGQRVLLATEESWNTLSQNGQSCQSAVDEIKGMYDEAVKTKAEFVKWVEKFTPIDDKAPEQLNEGMQEIRDEMLGMYEYDTDAFNSFIKALKKMVANIERTQKLDDLLIKRGAEKSHVGFADEYFLVIAKESLERYEKFEKERKEQEEKELLYSQLNEIKQEQQQIRYMQQQMNKANQPKQSFLDNFFE